MPSRKPLVMHVVGARPHFMKLAPVQRAMDASDTFEQIVVHTGQHYSHQLSGAFLEEFGLRPPDFNLAVGSNRHVPQMAQMMERLDPVLADQKPDVVMVYGDTNTTAAGAIAAAKTHTPLAHVEAGLREHDKQIPEEINKLLTDAVTDLYFCPTETAVNNLLAQGITEQVHLVGDTVLDWLNLECAHHDLDQCLVTYGLQSGEYYFMTCHRAANTDHPDHLRNIWSAMSRLSLPVIFPVHPRTEKAMEALGLNASPHVRLLKPVGFWETQSLIKHARAVLTDSGGIIKEAYFHHTPSLILDTQTEWEEVVREGWATITGPHADRIQNALADLRTPDRHDNVLGHGGAGKLIADLTLRFLNEER